MACPTNQIYDQPKKDITLILPACGESTRFPNSRPKFLLTHPYGYSMLRAGIDGLDLSNVKKIYAVVQQDHVERYGFTEGLRSQFDERFEWIVLDEKTVSQPETIAMAITARNIQGPIAIKDCDNYFECIIPRGNFVSISNLQDHSLINPSNKSYVTKHGYRVVHIMEKKIVSNIFSCGLYCFESAKYFVESFVKLQSSMFYVSDIITHMLNDDIDFYINPVKQYIDWGTAEDWSRYKDEFETLFIDLDGVLVKNSSQYLAPQWGETEPIKRNVEYLRRRSSSGKVTIIITTSRKEEYRMATLEQLHKHDIPFHRLIMGLLHGRRCIINDYAHSNPYPACMAVNIPRDASILEDLMR